MAGQVRGRGDIVFGNTAFLLCDMQERFRPAIKYFDDILEVCKRLTAASKILDIPLIVTEQYPKGLGATVPELDISHAKLKVEKTKFSMILPEVKESLVYGRLDFDEKIHAVLFGIETHVCIQQTAIDLLEMGLAEVYVVADACSSRSQMDRNFALERLRAIGCHVTTSESLLLQLVGDKEHPSFKEIQALIKTSAPTSGLVPSGL